MVLLTTSVCEPTNGERTFLLKIPPTSCGVEDTIGRYDENERTNTPNWLGNSCGVLVLGSDGEVEVFEKIEEIAKSYKMGDNIPFTAKFNGVFDPEKQPKVEESPAADVVDVEAEEV